MHVQTQRTDEPESAPEPELVRSEGVRADMAMTRTGVRLLALALVACGGTGTPAPERAQPGQPSPPTGPRRPKDPKSP